MSSLNWTFNTVAETYEKLRPGYVDELYQTIFEYKPINNTSSVVDDGYEASKKPSISIGL